MYNFICKHDTKFGMFTIGLCIAGFISDIQWHALARALGV